MIDILHHALRRVWYTRGMSLAAIACIALGTAATTTVATLVSATLVRPVPFATPERLVRIWFEEPGVNARVPFSIPDIGDFQNVEAFDAVLGTARVRTNARFAHGTERVRGEGVSAGYFETLGVGASLGRVLQRSDHAPGAPPVVVLSHGTWLRFFGGDPRVVLLTLAVLGVAGLVAGTVPALLGRQVAPGEVLRSGGRSTVGGHVERRWGAWLIACQTALTLVLLVAGALLVRSYGNLAATDLGYDRSRIARLAVTISPADAAPAALPDAYSRLQREVSGLPGVERVGLVYPTLPPWDGYRARFRIPGEELPHAPDGLDAGIHLVDEGLLPMLGVPLVSGRNLRDSDGSAADAVAVVSLSVAMLFGGPDVAVGRTIALMERSSRMPNGVVRIVGVAENIAWDGLAEGDTRRLLGADGSDTRSSRYDLYVPIARYPVPVVSIGVSTSGDPSMLIGTIQRRIGQLFPSSAVHWVSAMDDEVALEYAPARFYAVLVGVFSWSALALTSIGLFALLSQAATRRSPEMGLRMALGASPRSTAALLIRGGLLPVWVGIAAGFGLAGLTGRAMASLLYDVESYDPATFGCAAAALLAVTTAAAWIPARRVASVDPTVVLRSE